MTYDVAPEDGARFTIGGAFTVVHKIDGERTGGLVAVADHILEPHQLGSPRHTHHREHEISYVLEGTLGAEIGGTVFEAGPGTTVFKPKEVPHAFWNPGDVDLRFVEIFAPAGFEHYFDELAPLIPAGGVPRDLEALTSVYERHGLDVDPASMPELIRRHGLASPGSAEG
jgi:mannose-6-phosphate isomerase-like protein (cupin superfamily)